MITSTPNFQASGESENTHEFEFLHELIGAKTEDISNDEDAIC